MRHGRQLTIDPPLRLVILPGKTPPNDDVPVPRLSFQLNLRLRYLCSLLDV